MSDSRGAIGALRTSAPGTHGVGSMELFFDLVYVFTIIQLSHFLLHDLTWHGAAQTLVLFAAVWWGWNYTAWAMNWLDPDRPVVRVLLAVLMLLALGMAISLPEAFTTAAPFFVGAYVVFQLGRSAFMVLAFRGSAMSRNYAQLLAWSGISAVFWIAGAIAPEEFRLALWTLAVLIDYAAPGIGFWLPGIGRSAMSSWPLDEAHLAERNRLIFIIALGESILILGGALVGMERTAPVIGAAILGFTSIVLLCWLYFSARVGNAHHAAPQLTEATRVARGAYAYAHALMVAGAIVCAASVELVVSHPMDRTEWPTMLTLAGGPALFLVGNIIFASAHTGRSPVSRVIALIALVVILPLGVLTVNIVAAGIVTAVLAILLGVDHVSARSVVARSAPSTAH
ncbi:MAG: low temperature requirement protein A [Actinomycetota bacterium]